MSRENFVFIEISIFKCSHSDMQKYVKSTGDKQLQDYIDAQHHTNWTQNASCFGCILVIARYILSLLYFFSADTPLLLQVIRNIRQIQGTVSINVSTEHIFRGTAKIKFRTFKCIITWWSPDSRHPW